FVRRTALRARGRRTDVRGDGRRGVRLSPPADPGETRSGREAVRGCEKGPAMRNGFWAAVTVLTVGTVLVWTPAAWPADKSDPPGKDVFGLTRLWNLELTVPAKEWEKMQPAGGPRFPGFPGGPEKPTEKNGDVHKGSTFGLEYPWVTGDLAAE